MARFEWQDGNLGIARYTSFDEFSTVSAGRNRLLLRFDESENTFNERSSPFEVSFSLEDAEIAGFGAAGPIYSDGTVTQIRFLARDGDELLTLSNLELSLSAVSSFLTNSVTYDLFSFIASGGHRFVGSNDASDETGGGTGDDMQTGSGDDIVRARGGDDYIRDQGGSDDYAGGAGYDTLAFSEWYFAPVGAVRGISVNLTKGTIIGPDRAADTVTGIEAIHGSFLNDRIIGDGADNLFTGMQGRDFMNGRGGEDTVSYRDETQQGATLGIEADLRAGTVRDGFGSVDRIRNIEIVVGSDNADVFIDDNRDSWFRGHVGRDEFRSGQGNDRMEGGEDADLFVFRGLTFGDDIISDFSQEEGDQISILQAGSFADLAFESEQSNLIIYYGEGSVLLAGYYARPGNGTITEDDFIFV